MLKVRYGPFYPELEDAFSARLAELSASGLGPVAVVAPSRRMAQRLERLVALERGLPLWNVHFHTFYSLALAVTEDAWDDFKLVSDPVFHDRIVDGLLCQHKIIGRIFGAQARPKALAGALRSSIRDLIDAGVSGENLEEFFGEELLPQPEERERLRAVLHLCREYEERLKHLKILSPSALVRMAAAQAQNSEFLRQFKELLYYGFYDLTGLQLDFFEAVAARHPVQLFFPFRRGHPAFRFAEPFFTQKLLACDAEEIAAASERKPALQQTLDVLFKPDKSGISKAENLRVFSVSGARDEIWTAAKEILRLVESEGFAYEDIAVVARTLEPYRAAVTEIFRENCIPCDLVCAEPLLRHPLAKCALNLLTLRLRDYPAVLVEDVLASPYYRGRPEHPVENWRMIIRQLGIHGGWLQWRGKLAPRVKEPFALRSGRIIPPEHVRGLWEFILGVERELGDEKVSTWSDKTALARRFLEYHLCPGEESRERAVWEAVLAALESLAGFDLLGEPGTWSDFLDCFADQLKRATLDLASGCRGVRILNAMDARGEVFRVTFLIGLKEKLFPRLVVEDPLLRDSVRAVLRHPAGYWIAQKSAGHEEERLLFYLMAASARERLYCIYPRSDESGRSEVPSLYLRELCRAAGVTLADATLGRHVPRQPAAKLEILSPAVATPKEVSLRLALEGESAAQHLKAAGRDAGYLDETLERAAAIGAWGRAGEFDGLVGPPDRYLHNLQRSGISPSALDSFACCPFQFFAARVLGLGVEQEAYEKGEFSPTARGRIYHAVLERFYRGADVGLWESPEAWAQKFEAAVAEVFTENSWQEMGVYPLLWLAAKAAMTMKLRDFVAWDLAEVRTTGLRPAHLEKLLRGPLRAQLPAGLARLEAQGIVDRIDLDSSGRCRIVDYKTRWREGGLRARIRSGNLHQLPLYAELIREGACGPLESACIYAIEDSPQINGRPRCLRYEPSEWEEDRAAFFAGVTEALADIAAGRFPITPQDGPHGNCARCAFPLLCRKSHGPSRTRAAAILAPAPDGKSIQRNSTKANSSTGVRAIVKGKNPKALE